LGDARPGGPRRRGRGGGSDRRSPGAQRGVRGRARGAGAAQPLHDGPPQPPAAADPAPRGTEDPPRGALRRRAGATAGLPQRRPARARPDLRVPGNVRPPHRGGAMSSSEGRVVLGGASGFMGRAVRAKYLAEGREVVTIGRSGADLRWEDQGGIDAAVDGAALLIGLAGKSVDCRYTRANRAEIFSSRLRTTRALHRAVSRAARPPALWANASTATIYRHAMDRPQTESDGELGTGFSVEVARAWEDALFEGHLPTTRRVALRTAIVLGDGGVLGMLRRLATFGISGTQSDGRWPTTSARRRAGTAHDPGSRRGRQRFSWIHLDDVLGILDFLETTPSLAGPVNLSSPH